MTKVQRICWWILVSLTVLGAPFIWPQFTVAQNPLFVLPVLAYVVVGVVLTTRRPGNSVGWVFLGVGALTGLLIASAVVATWAADVAGPFPWWGVLFAWFATWVWYPLLYLLTVPILLLFPNGLLSPRWKVVLWGSASAAALMTVLAATTPEIGIEFDSEGDVTRSIANPLGSSLWGDLSRPEDHPLFPVAGLALLVCFAMAVVSVGIRMRRSGEVERLQLRWFGFAVATFVPLIVAEVLFGGERSPVWLMVFEAGVVAAIPISCGVAILRYRLYDIDRIISRTTSYAIVTGFLLGSYALIVTVVSVFLPDSNTLGVAAATLTAAAAFRPLLRRVRQIVDRRFDREHYDAELAVADFADRLRESHDVEVVATDLESVVGRAFQPNQCAVWVRPSLAHAPGTD